jgi:predicted ArsR family transcriptional regulator
VSASDRDSSIEGVALLRDPLRRAIYDYVARSPEPVGRDAVAAEVDASRSLVAFHLDKLVAQGLLQTSFRRLSGRVGPGAGRPAKLYERSDQQLEVSLPAREYELAAHLLLAAVDGKGNTAERVRKAARELGENTGADDAERHGAPRGRAASLDRLEPVLERFGYEPFREGRALCLRNCPFHALAEQSPDTVCGMNLALIDGLLVGLRAKGLTAELAPSPDRCCVEIRESVG